MTIFNLVEQLKVCPPGQPGWKEFEDICFNILTYLFVPPLRNPRRQSRTYSGIARRDAIFANRDFDPSNTWGQLYEELGARLILFEFKNYDSEEIKKEEVNQTLNYLTDPMGKLAILCCNKKPSESAHIRRNTIYSHNEIVILFVLPDDLVEMISIKERGEDPADFIMDLVEDFYLQHE